MTRTAAGEGDRGPSVVSRGLRILLLAVGVSSTALGVLGIFLPLLPTVPLLLLAAACFARSSDRFYRWLLEHRHLGPMVRDYLAGEGIPLRAKATAIVLVWVTIPLTVLFFVTLPWLRVLLLAVGAGITLYLLRLPLREPGAGLTPGCERPREAVQGRSVTASGGTESVTVSPAEKGRSR